MQEGRAGGFYKFFKKLVTVQEMIDLNISWPSNFFRKYFMGPPINFSFLFEAYMQYYFTVLFSNVKISNHQRSFTIIFRKLSVKFSKKPVIFFAIQKIILQQQNKNHVNKIHHHLFKNQSLELSSLSEIDNIIQEEEEIFKKNPTVSLPEVSKVIDSAISKRQRDRRKHSFLERNKTYCIKGKMDSL